jgi:alpha-mannosidase
MHDEAATHFVGMLDQTTLGHRFLRDEFDVAPTVHATTTLASSPVNQPFDTIDDNSSCPNVDDFSLQVGWQLDPFGHSATQAALLGAEIGMDALFFGRIDYQVLLFWDCYHL